MQTIQPNYATHMQTIQMQMASLCNPISNQLQLHFQLIATPFASLCNPITHPYATHMQCKCIQLQPITPLLATHMQMQMHSIATHMH
jgi:hypothetical protein